MAQINKITVRGGRYRKRDQGVTTTTDGPTALQMVKNLNAARKELNEKGWKLAPRAVYEERLRICKACEYWDDQARGGLGKCSHAKCGCTKLKHKFAAMACPVGKWLAKKVN